MKRRGDKVVEVDNENENELTELERQQSEEEVYREIFGDDEDLSLDDYEEAVIVPDDGV
jgi:hypothetical protein